MAEPVAVDVVVVGAGTAGLAACRTLAAAGLSVAVVEAELAGGAAAYWADIPLDALRLPGEVLLAAQSVPGAQDAVTTTLDAAATLQWRNSLVHHWQDDAAAATLERAGVQLLRGRARITGPRQVSVARLDGGTEVAEAALAVVLATGSAPEPVGEELHSAGAACWGTREALSAATVPHRLVVAGGGPLAAAIAQAYARLGSRVVLAAPDGLLPGWPAPAVELAAASMRADGIQLWRTTGATKATAGGGSLVVELANGHTVDCDALLVDTPRRPLLAGLGLESLEIPSGPGSPGGLRLDALRLDAHGLVQGTDWLYLAGDAAGAGLRSAGSGSTAPGAAGSNTSGSNTAGSSTAGSNTAAFSSTAAADQGRRAAASILAAAGVEDGRASPARGAAGPALAPRMVYTDPLIAAVGPSLEQARHQGLDPTVLLNRVSSADATPARRAGGHADVFSQLLVDPDTSRLLGATFAGPDAAALAQLAALAITARLPAGALLGAAPPPGD